jgi:histidine triad (HIT) family protein
MGIDVSSLCEMHDKEKDMADDCLFCKIIAGEVPATMRYEDDRVVAFDDISAQAPVHYLIVPKAHIETVNDLTADHEALVGHMVLVAKQLAADLKIEEAGYRLVLNCNSEGGQAVYHIHLHLLGGRQMGWPPG